MNPCVSQIGVRGVDEDARVFEGDGETLLTVPQCRSTTRLYDGCPRSFRRVLDHHDFGRRPRSRAGRIDRQPRHEGPVLGQGDRDVGADFNGSVCVPLSLWAKSIGIHIRLTCHAPIEEVADHFVTERLYRIAAL